MDDLALQLLPTLLPYRETFYSLFDLSWGLKITPTSSLVLCFCSVFMRCHHKKLLQRFNSLLSSVCPFRAKTDYLKKKWHYNGCCSLSQITDNLCYLLVCFSLNQTSKFHQKALRLHLCSYFLIFRVKCKMY